MPDIDKERMADNLRTIAQAGGVRARRMGQILRVAFSGMATEVKEGSTEIGPVAKELMAAVGESLKKTSQEATVKINDALKENNVDSQDIFSRLKSIVQTVARAIDENLLPPLKEQIAKLDLTLTERYGDRYDEIKDFIKDLTTFSKSEKKKKNDATTWRQSTSMRAKEKDGVTWYEPVEAQAETGESSPFGQPPREVNGKLFTVETTASQSDAS